MLNTCVVAIDGQAASGKGTVAKRLANGLGFSYLDTGLLYRAVTATLLAEGSDYHDVVQALTAAKALRYEDLHSSFLHNEEVSSAVSVVAAMPDVREELRAYQRNFPRPPGAVIDGRDIGTSIFPEATVKFFITASPEVRAARSIERLRERGGHANYREVLRQIIERDRMDAERAVSPMKPAEDATLIDTTDMDRDDVFVEVLTICARQFAAMANIGLGLVSSGDLVIRS